MIEAVNQDLYYSKRSSKRFRVVNEKCSEEDSTTCLEIVDKKEVVDTINSQGYPYPYLDDGQRYLFEGYFWKSKYDGREFGNKKNSSYDNLYVDDLTVGLNTEKFYDREFFHFKGVLLKIFPDGDLLLDCSERYKVCRVQVNIRNIIFVDDYEVIDYDK